MRDGVETGYPTQHVDGPNLTGKWGGEVGIIGPTLVAPNDSNRRNAMDDGNDGTGCTAFMAAAFALGILAVVVVVLIGGGL